MSQISKQAKATRRANRTRAKIRGTSKRPRVSIYASQTGIFAQFIDDAAGKTIISGRDNKETGVKTERAAALGKKLAAIAKEKGIATVVFDRGAKKYHGRVRAFAESLREGGLAL